MAIIDKTLKSVENYIKNNEKTDDFYKEKALEILRKFGRPEIAGNVSMQAVVGFVVGFGFVADVAAVGAAAVGVVVPPEGLSFGLLAVCPEVVEVDQEVEEEPEPTGFFEFSTVWDSSPACSLPAIVLSLSAASLSPVVDAAASSVFSLKSSV